MSWTEERVELLKKLWLDGRSASQIANELACDITRNAVIGKVHRLGLAGRNIAPGASTPRPRPSRRAVTHESGGGMSSHPMMSGGGAPMSHGATALAYQPEAEMEPAPSPLPMEGVVIPMTNRVTILELRESMCRWPIGDPTSPEFRYCGGDSPIGQPYCAHHARIAYQPAQDRRRDRERRAAAAAARPS